MRESYLVHEVFSSFFLAAVLSSAVAQFALMIDAVIIGRTIGEQGLYAINLMMPLVSVISAVAMMLALGADDVVAKTLGGRDKAMAANIFTTSMVLPAVASILLTVPLFVYGDSILAWLYPASKHVALAQEYLRSFAPSTFFIFVSVTCLYLICLDGKPIIASRMILLGGAVNVALDFFFLKKMHWGIHGSSLATTISLAAILLMSLTYFFRKKSSFKWHWPGLRFFSISGAIMKSGFMILVVNLALASLAFLTNSIIIKVADTVGLFSWSVCVQVLFVVAFVVNGGILAMYGLASKLLAEHDFKGMEFLYQRLALTIVAFFLMYMMAVCFRPIWFVRLFQGGAAVLPRGCGPNMAIFSTMMLPFSIALITASMHHVLGYRVLGTTMGLLTFVCMALGVVAFSFSPDHVWWGFSAGAAAVVAAQFVCAAIIRRKNPNLAFFTLIPKTEEGKILDLSVEYSPESLAGALKEIRSFLKGSALPAKLVFRLQLCAEELMQNLVQHAATSQAERCFDLQIAILSAKAKLLIKDDGVPFNPAEADDDSAAAPDPRASGKGLGLTLVRGLAHQMTYEHTYGQNITVVSFQIENQNPATK